MPSLPSYRRAIVALLLLVCAAPLLVRGASADPLMGAGQIDAYVMAVDRAGLPAVANGQYDILGIKDRDGGYEVALALSPEDAAELGLRGVAPQLWRDSDSGLTFSQTADVALQEGFEVWRSYDEPGGIRDELERLVVENPDIVERIVIGTTHQGREILALRVTRDANEIEQGSRPAVLFNSLQHAREWIAIETNRRYLNYFLDNDGVDEQITALIDTTEVWFVVCANPDGYEHTFTEGNRLWRKNLRDNDGDGEITREDGVDPNRNFSSRWNYDTAGSSGSNTSATYRGPGPASEPMVQALQDLLQRIDFGMMLNIHSAAELILWPDGWQDETRTADDPIYSALAGDFFEPAVEGFDPILSSGLYITNGETCDYAHAKTDTLCYTPELSTPPEGSVEPGTSGFQFPDDETLIQEEFERNLPFMLSIAQSTADPTRPVSVLGRTIEPFYVDEFTWSYGSPQLVQVNAMRRLGEITMYYRINDGPTYRQSTAESRSWASRSSAQGGGRFIELSTFRKRSASSLTTRWRSPPPATRERTGSPPTTRISLSASSTPTGRSISPFDDLRPTARGATLLSRLRRWGPYLNLTFTGALPGVGQIRGATLLKTVWPTTDKRCHPLEDGVAHDRATARPRGSQRPLLADRLAVRT